MNHAAPGSAGGGVSCKGRPSHQEGPLSLFSVQTVDEPVQKPCRQHLGQEGEELVVEAYGVQRVVMSLPHGHTCDVIAFTITSSLSGSYNAACAAGKNCTERNPARRIHVVDTLSAGPEITLLLEKALSEQSSGAGFDEVCENLKAYQRRTHLLFALESMHNLAQNGRISRLTATMAGVLGIRAVGEASAEGTLEMLGKCRGGRKTQHFMLCEMERLGYGGGSVRIGHCQNEVLAQELCSELLHLFPQADIKSYPLRGLCSYYAERGGVIVGFETM